MWWEAYYRRLVDQEDRIQQEVERGEFVMTDNFCRVFHARQSFKTSEEQERIVYMDWNIMVSSFVY